MLVVSWVSAQVVCPQQKDRKWGKYSGNIITKASPIIGKIGENNKNKLHFTQQIRESS